MDFSMFFQSDPSGRFSKESFLIKNHPLEYQYIQDYSIKNKLNLLDFKEKVYLCINDIGSVPVCANGDCDGAVKFRNSTVGYLKYCSIKCVSSDPKVKKIKESKSMEKYGTKTPAESMEIKEKIIKTNQEKYGKNSAMCLAEFQQKSRETLLKNYGILNPSESYELVEKRIKSFKLSNYKNNYKKKSIENYGTNHPWSNKIIHDKCIESIQKIKNLTTEKLIKEKLLNYPNHRLNSIDFSSEKKNINMDCPVGHNFEINRHLLYERNILRSEICTICNPITKGISGMEISLLNFIKENYKGEIIENGRKLIKPYEIDIFLPEINLAIEFNGLYWHSSENKEKNYHANKHNMCENKNVRLVSIWEDDWIYRNEIVKSFILNKLNKTAVKIFARKTEIKEVSYKESKSFLEKNHFQGDCKSPIRIGLYNNDELVTIMTFSKLRLPLNGKNTPDTYELTRFCNKINTNVIGGASKIFNYFIRKYNPIEINTYSDNQISNGDLYLKLGFKYIHTSNPGYWYLINGRREHRFNWRKSKLIKLGHDKNLTEIEIMRNMGYYQIFNAGNKKWRLTIPKH